LKERRGPRIHTLVHRPGQERKKSRDPADIEWPYNFTPMRGAKVSDLHRSEEPLELLSRDKEKRLKDVQRTEAHKDHQSPNKEFGIRRIKAVKKR